MSAIKSTSGKKQKVKKKTTAKAVGSRAAGMRPAVRCSPDATPYNGKYKEKPEEKDEEKCEAEDKCEERAESWFPNKIVMVGFTKWAKGKGFAKKAFDFDKDERELDEYLLEYVYSETDSRYDPHLPVLQFLRRVWFYLRETRRLSVAGSLGQWSQLLNDQHIYWERLKHLGKRPLADWSQTRLEVDKLLAQCKLHIPEVFLIFAPKTLGEGMYRVLRRIVFTADNGYSMWCKLGGCKPLSAYDYAIRSGAVTLQQVFAEYLNDRSMAPKRKLQAVSERQLEDEIHVDSILSAMTTAAESSAAVKRVGLRWERGQLVDNISFQLAQCIQPDIGGTLLRLAKDRVLDSDFLLRQLHTSKSSIIDWQLLKGALEVIDETQREAALKLKTVLKKLLSDSEQKKAFDAICAIKSKEFKATHGVYMWRGTEVSESAKPLMTEASADSLAADHMSCDSETTTRSTVDRVIFATTKRLHSRYIHPRVVDAVTSKFKANEVLRLASLSFAEPKSAEGSKQKAVEYLRVGAKDYVSLLKIVHAFLELFADGICTIGKIRFVLVRIKNTFDEGKLGRFGDIKVKTEIAGLMPDGSYYTTTCECSFNLTQAQVCHKWMHGEYELKRQRDFYETVYTAKASAQTILSSADIDAMFPRVDFWNTFFGGNEAVEDNCRHILQLAGVSLKYAKQLVSLLPATSRNPLEGKGVAVCNLVFNHSKDLGEWLKLLKHPRLFGADQSWKKLKNMCGQTPVAAYMSTGDFDMAMIQELKGPHAFGRDELRDRFHVSVVHYLAMSATAERIEQFDKVFGGVMSLFLSEDQCPIGPPLAAYLNAAGQNANVELARAFLPADRNADVFKRLLCYVDVTQKALEVIKALFTPLQFNNMKVIGFNGFLPVVLFVARATTDCKDPRFRDMVRALVHTQVFLCRQPPRHMLQSIADVYSPDELKTFFGYKQWKTHVI